MSHAVSTPRIASYAVLALVPALLLAGCGGAGEAEGSPQAPPVSEVADSAQVDAAIEETPCELAPAEMVAGIFGVPATELERQSSMSSSCVYAWEGDTTQLDVAVDVAGVHEDAESAARRFRSVTAGMSGAELDRVMDGMKDELASQGKLDSDGERLAADAVVANSSDSAGIRFEDVEGVGDEARMALTVGAGDLHVRAGNLNFTVSAYSGPTMPMPEELTYASMMSANKAWQQDTLPQRKQAAVKLAKAIVASL